MTSLSPSLASGEAFAHRAMPGDVMRLGIDGLGQQQQRVHGWDPALIDA